MATSGKKLMINKKTNWKENKPDSIGINEIIRKATNRLVNINKKDASIQNEKDFLITVLD